MRAGTTPGTAATVATPRCRPQRLASAPESSPGRSTCSGPAIASREPQVICPASLPPVPALRRCGGRLSRLFSQRLRRARESWAMPLFPSRYTPFPASHTRYTYGAHYRSIVPELSVHPVSVPVQPACLSARGDIRNALSTAIVLKHVAARVAMYVPQLTGRAALRLTRRSAARRRCPARVGARWGCRR